MRSKSSAGGSRGSPRTPRRSAPSSTHVSASSPARSRRRSPEPDPVSRASVPGKQTGAGFVYATANRHTVSETTEIIGPDGGESSKVESWRLHVLMEAGYPLPLAEKLAGSEADLHRAVELVGQGCDPETAVEILL